MKRLLGFLAPLILAVGLHAQATPVQPRPTTQALMAAAALSPTTADNTTYVTPFSLYNYYSAQSATGPYSPTSFTANNILIGNGTGAILVSGATVTNSGNVLTLAGTSTITDNGAGTLDTFSAPIISPAGTFTTLTVQNASSLGGTAYSFGALPSGATTAGTVETVPATTYTLTGANTATAFQAIYHDVPTFTNASAGVVTDLFSEDWVGPAAVAGSQTGTRKHTLGILDPTTASSSIIGAVVIATTYGTTGSSIAMGGGNINAGNVITSGNGLQATSGNLNINSGATTLNGGSAATSLTVTNTARVSGVLPYIKYTIPTDTSQTVSTESPGILGVTGIRTWAGAGTVALQREIYWPGPTYAGVGSTTFTDVFNSYWDKPIQGTNSTFTRPHTLGIVDSTSAVSSITGGVIVATTLGTAATSVGIGGGNVNAGGTIASGGAMTVGTTVSSYNGVATAGNGVGVVVSAPRQTALTNALATLATYTVPAADSSFIITANVQVTATTAAAMTVVCTYTDETNTSRAQTIPFCQLAGTFLTSITNATGTGPYEGASLHIRCKASTTIVFTTAGTVTGITYNIQGTVIQTG